MINQIFPNYFYSIITPPNKDELLEIANNSSVSDDQNFSWGNECLLKKERLEKETISNALVPSLLSFFDEIGIKFDIEVTDVWKNTYEKGFFQDIHDHPNCDLSAVLFLDEMKVDKSEFFFYNRHGSEMTEFWKRTNRFSTYFIRHNIGDVLFFPSHMLHGVTPHKSEEKRQTISFNMKFC